MDLTTRRVELEGTVPEQVVPMNGECRELVNGAEGACDATVTTGEVAPAKKTTSFSIRNLMGGEDEREPTTDGSAKVNHDGKFYQLFCRQF